MILKCEEHACHVLEALKNSILPGDPCDKKSSFIVFEDPFFFFYHRIFPILKRKNLRVLLGVSPRYILEKTNISTEERLKIPKGLAYQDGFFETKAPFCTWEELMEMVRSGYVEVACHSFSKMDLTNSFVNLEREVIMAKEVLETHLPQAISFFIFPFGKTSKSLQKLVKSYYPYSLP